MAGTSEECATSPASTGQAQMEATHTTGLQYQRTHRAQDSEPFVASRKQVSTPVSPEEQAATVVDVTYFCYRNYSVSGMNVA